MEDTTDTQPFKVIDPEQFEETAVTTQVPQRLIETQISPVVKSPERDRFDLEASERQMEEILERHRDQKPLRGLAKSAIAEQRKFKEDTPHGEEYHDEYHTMAAWEASMALIDEARRGNDVMGLESKVEVRGLTLDDLAFASSVMWLTHDMANNGELEVNESGYITIVPNPHPVLEGKHRFRSGEVSEGRLVEDVVIERIPEIYDKNFRERFPDQASRAKIVKLTQDLAGDTKFPTPRGEASEFNDFVQLVDQSGQAYKNRKGIVRNLHGLLQEWTEEGKLPPIDSTDSILFYRNRMEAILNPTRDQENTKVDDVDKIWGGHPELEEINRLIDDPARPKSLVEFSEYLEQMTRSTQEHEITTPNQ